MRAQTVGQWGWLVARLTLTRYLATSLLALCVDMGLFAALVMAGVSASLAAFVSYGAGIAVHWLLSTHFVFIGAIPDRQRHMRLAQFLLSALMGLATTVAIVSALTALAIHPMVAKGIAVIISFIFVYLVRKHVIFAKR